MKKNFFPFLLLAGSLAFSACEKTPPPPPVVEEQELITTLRLKFLNSGSTTTYQFRDLDGTGGNAPTRDTIKIAPFRQYAVSIEVLDESGTVVDSITPQIKAEQDDHLFCFATSKVNLSILRTDLDSRNMEVGLTSRWEASGTGIGSVTVTLKHQPGIKTGDCAPGDTDIEVTFPVTIQ